MMYKIGDIVIVNGGFFQIIGIKDDCFYEVQGGVIGKFLNGKWFCFFKVKYIKYYF